MTGAGEPPMPGMSNRMTGRCGSSASTNGWNSSRLTPMPLHSSKGGRPGAPSRTATRMARPPTVSILIPRAGPIRPPRVRPTGPRPVCAQSLPAGPGRDGSAVTEARFRRVAVGCLLQGAQVGDRVGQLVAEAPACVHRRQVVELFAGDLGEAKLAGAGPRVRDRLFVEQRHD